MSKRLSAAEIFDELEVDLWGSEYTLRTITKSVSGKVDAAQKKAEALGDEAGSEEMVAALIEVIDALLAPKDSGPRAADMLTEMWDEDKLGVDWLTAFAQSLQEEAVARRRPTSATKSGS